jgi:NADH:ubiquinone oxidoreductase subunit F (NADH-binding)
MSPHSAPPTLSVAARHHLPWRTPAGVGLDGLLADPLSDPVSYDAHRPVRLTGPDPDDLDAHLLRYGPCPAAFGSAGEQLIDTLDRIGLSGRGGGHFPAARKWLTVLRSGAAGVVVANAAEGEPASAKDAALLQHRPHLVLDGLACAAQAVAATRAVVWLHTGADATRRAVLRALAERHAAGLADPPVEVVTGPDGYLSGESSAIVRALSGGPALPSFSRRPAARAGIAGRPTLVHNVETLARVAIAARTGSAGYRDSTLVTVVAGGRRTVLELLPQTTLGSAVDAALGSRVGTTDARVGTTGSPFGTTGSRAGTTGSPAAPRAVLVGGYGGSWLPWPVAATLPLNEPALRAAGAGLGCGVLAVLPGGCCGLAQTAALVDYLARSGAGQCGPCLFGLNDLAGLFTDLSRGRARRADLRRVLVFTGEIEGRGACHHPDGVIRLLRTALTTFADEVDHHLRRRCTAQDAAPAFPLPLRVQP